MAEQQQTAFRNRGADALIAALEQAGTRTIFALSGNHIMPVFDAALDHPVKLIHVRHEAAAVHMADAWARLSGQVGVALVTAGQGHANAAAALCTTQGGETPLLLLSGHAPLSELGFGSFQEQRQAELAAPVTKASWTAQSAASLPDDIARACRIARSGRPGPVHISLPADVLESDGDLAGALALDAARFAPEPMPLPKAATAQAWTALADASRPLVVAPPALATPSGAALLARLRAALGVPVVTMESPRGINDPALGAFAEVLAEADLILLLGKPLDFTLRFGKAPAVAPQCRWIVIDPEPELRQRAERLLGERLLFAAGADARSAASGLSELAAGDTVGHAAWRKQVEATIAYRPAAWDATAPAADTPMHPLVLCRALQQQLDRRPDSVLVSDGGEFGQWAQATLHAPCRVINGVAGAIGPSLPFAIGAKAARPESTVLAVLGDGTFGFHMAEFDTAMRSGLPFVAVVGNDSRWNAEHQIQLRHYGPARTQGCTLAQATRYDLVAAGLGGHGEFVRRAAELPAALDRAFASGKPACVNVLIEGVAAPVVRRR
ncbi:MAG TPA: thiamine pyrophosphate-binding protein [Stellaceae bacterium]|nr:thiamine pyrophosphate-binding protein [Stellaceae bacterium]